MRTRLLLSTALLALSATAAWADEPGVDPGPEVEVDPITVIATRTATPVDEVPATVSVITAEQIERLLITDIKDLVRFEPGVSVVSQPARFGAALGTTGRAGNEGFTIRGLGGDRVLIVVDGVRTPDSFAFGAQSVGRGGYTDLDLVKSVEILRGPASALYGSDGVAGAVSFTTKDPIDFLSGGQAFGARARVGYTSADEGWTEGLAVAGRAGALSGLVAYTRRDAQETETQGEVGGTGAARTQANPQDIQSNAVLAKLVWDVAANQRLRLTYDHYDMEMSADVLSGRLPPAPPFVPNAVLELLAEDETTRDRIGLDWRGEEVLGLDRAQVAAYWQEAETRQFTFEDRSPAVDRIRDNTFDNRVYGIAADATRGLTLGGISHRLTFGGDWSETRQQGVRDGTVPPFGETFPTSPFPVTDYTLAGAFIQDEIALLDGTLRIIPALRYDAYDLSTEADPLYTGQRADQDDGRLSPKLGVVWQLDPRFQLFAGYAEGFKAPTPSQVNNGFSNIASGYISVPNADLGPETSRSLEGGMRFRDIGIAGGLLSLSTTAFQSDYDDFISQQVVSGSFTPADPAVFQFVNFSAVEVWGLEARGDIVWDNGVSLTGSAAYADGRQTTGGQTTDLATIDPIKLVAGLGYDDPNGVFGGQAIVTWSQEKDGDLRGLSCTTACFTGDDFTLLDLVAYWNVTERVTARAGVFNVFDETYSWWSDVRGVGSTSTITDAYTQPGPNFSLSLVLRL